MSQKIEVLIPGYTSYHVTVAEAKRMTANGDAIWVRGQRKLCRSADISKRGFYEKRGSGQFLPSGVVAGPGVLQLT